MAISFKFAVFFDYLSFVCTDESGLLVLSPQLNVFCAPSCSKFLAHRQIWNLSNEMMPYECECSSPAGLWQLDFIWDLTSWSKLNFALPFPAVDLFSLSLSAALMLSAVLECCQFLFSFFLFSTLSLVTMLCSKDSVIVTDWLQKFPICQSINFYWKGTKSHEIAS